MNFKHKSKYSLNSLTIAILLIGIMAILNIISLRHYARLDLTADKQFTVNKATKDTVKNLSDVVTIKAFFSKDLPPYVGAILQQAKDILSEYKANGNVVIQYINPDGDESAKTEAQSLGIPEFPLQILEKDKQQTQKVFLGLAIFYGDKKEIIPVINLDTLEYDVTSSLKKLTADKIKIIGFLTGHEEYTAISANPANPGEADLSLLAQALSKNYELKPVDLKAGQPITDVDTLIIAGPKQAFLDRELYLIDQFIMAGGHVIFLIDQVSIGDGLQAVKNQTNLDGLLANLGITVSNKIMLDTSNAMATFNQGMFSFSTPYPFWPKLIKQYFSVTNPIVNQLDQLVLPWASPLEITKKDNVETEILAYSSDKAWAQPEPFNFDPNYQPQVSPNDLKQYPMIALLRGKWTSYFAEKQIPPRLTDQTTPAKEPAVDQSEPESIKQSAKESNILVVGDADFAINNFVRPGQFPQNLNFLLNSIDYLTLDPSLISIRSRGIQQKNLKDLSEGQKTSFKIIGLALMPTIVILYGLIRSFRRKRAKKNSFIF